MPIAIALTTCMRYYTMDGLLAPLALPFYILSDYVLYSPSLFETWAK